MPTIPPEQKRDYLINYLVDVIVLSQAAEKQNLVDRPDVKRRLAFDHNRLLMESLLQDAGKSSLSEDAERKVYEEAVKQVKNEEEVHARHILVATEPFAQQVVARLEKGDKFDDIAKKESMDSSKDNGGDLGWFTPDRMVPQFAAAVVELKPGDYTHKPVQTQYGWHVIQLVETRPLSPPPFDQVKQRLDQMVEAKKFKAFTDDLVSKAKIDRKTPAPAATTPPPAPKAG